MTTMAKILLVFGLILYRSSMIESLFTGKYKKGKGISESNGCLRCMTVTQKRYNI